MFFAKKKHKPGYFIVLAVNLLVVISIFLFTFLVISQTRQRVNSQSIAAQEYKIPVLELRYFPLKGKNLDPEISGINDKLEDLQTKLYLNTKNIVSLLTKGSIYKGYKNTFALPTLRYSIYETKDFLEPIPVSTNLAYDKAGTFRPDYLKIMTDLNICDYVDNKGVKEVWIWSYHTNKVEPDESNMSMGYSSQKYWNHDTYGDVSNGQQINDLPTCQKTYALFNYNFQGGEGMALEDHTHHLERIFDYINFDLFEKEFVGIGARGKEKAVYYCGDTHSPPNVVKYFPQQQYNWESEEKVNSDCSDWNPQHSGKQEIVDCHTWAGNDCEKDLPDKPNSGGTAWKVWWMQNLPGKNNNLTYQEKKLINWWDYIGDFDKTINETNKSFFIPTPSETILQPTNVTVPTLPATVQAPSVTPAPLLRIPDLPLIFKKPEQTQYVNSLRQAIAPITSFIAQIWKQLFTLQKPSL